MIPGLRAKIDLCLCSLDPRTLEALVEAVERVGLRPAAATPAKNPFVMGAETAIDILPIAAGLTLWITTLFAAYHVGRGFEEAPIRRVTKTEISLDEASRGDVRGSSRRAVHYDALSRLSLASDYSRGIYPESLTTREYRGVIAYAVDSDSIGMAQFDKAALREIATALGLGLPPTVTKQDLRTAIADVARLDYDPDRSTDPFRKPELMRLAEYLVDKRIDGRLDLGDDEEGSE